MLEQIKKVIANGNQSGVVNSKIAVFKKTAVVEKLSFKVDIEDKAALYNILPLYWLVADSEDGIIFRVGNCPATTVYETGHVDIEGTQEEVLEKEACYLVIANWPDNATLITDDVERVI